MIYRILYPGHPFLGGLMSLYKIMSEYSNPCQQRGKFRE